MEEEENEGNSTSNEMDNDNKDTNKDHHHVMMMSLEEFSSQGYEKEKEEGGGGGGNDHENENEEKPGGIAAGVKGITSTVGMTLKRMMRPSEESIHMDEDQMKNISPIDSDTPLVSRDDIIINDDDDEILCVDDNAICRQNIEQELHKRWYKDRQQSMLVMIVDEQGHDYIKDMRRDELLEECRKNATASSIGGTGKGRSVRGITQPRDIRLLDPAFSSHNNIILIRWHAFLVILGEVHAIILRDKLILVIPNGADRMLQNVVSHFRDLTKHTTTYQTTTTSITNNVLVSDIPSKKSSRSLFQPQNDPLAHVAGVKRSASSALSNNSNSGGAILPGSIIATLVTSNQNSDQNSIKSEPTLSTTQQQATQQIPFEFRALECLLILVCDSYDLEIGTLRSNILRTSRAVIKKSSGATLERLRQSRNSIAMVMSRIRALLDALDEILKDDHDMAMMNLTRIHQFPDKFNLSNLDDWSDDHEEVEYLLENYVQHLARGLSELELLDQELQNTENTIMLRLDTARNSLLRVNLMVSTVTSTAAVGSLVGAIFGMNLNSGVQEDPIWFWAVAATLFFGMMLVTLLVFMVLYLKGYMIT